MTLSRDNELKTVTVPRPVIIKRESSATLTLTGFDNIFKEIKKMHHM